jgi:hypothetical protein
MKLIKIILPIFLIFALALPSYASFLPESKIVDRQMTVEEDENIVDNSIDGIPTDRPSKTFIMSKQTYLVRIIVPLLFIFAIGPTYLLVEREIKIYKEKSHSH